MLIDSNILIYSLNTASPKCKAAQSFLQSQMKKLVFSQQNIFETLRILTHHKFSQPFSSDAAIMAIRTIVDQGRLLSPTLETPAIAFRLIQKYRIIGTEIFDAYLVATALSNAVTAIATDNVKHLSKYTEITVINPF